MEAAQQYHQPDCTDEQWQDKYDYVSEPNTEEELPDTPSSDAEAEADDGDSGTQSSCLCKAPEQPPQDHLNLRFSSGTADLSGHGAVHEQLPAGTLIDRCYKITGMVGKGSFGAAYAAEHVDTGLQVVIKARVSTSGTYFSESLKGELNIYMQLNAQGHQNGIPRLYSAGVHKLSPCSTSSGMKPVCVSYLAIQRLGPSIWTSCHKEQGPRQLTWRPSRQDMLHIASGMLKALAAIHSRGFMHKDVKTDNFCMNREQDRITSMYAIDYGFSRPAFGQYDYGPYFKWEASFWGTPNYASLSSLQRIPQTPRDDLEALVYCLLELEQQTYFLPWNLTTNAEAAAGWSDKQLERMSKEKRAAWHCACEEGHVPPYLNTYFSYITGLRACHCPDYQYLLGLLQSGLKGHKLPSKPQPKAYRAWPAADERYDHQEVTTALLQELKAAASEVLPEAPGAAIATELQLQLDEQRDEQQQAPGKQQSQRYAATVEALAPVDAAGTFEGDGDSLCLAGADEVNSAVLQRCKRQRVTAAAAGAGVFDLGTTGMWPAAAALNVIEGSQSQPEE